jgi:uncharacterized membrane protein YbhN (UPF0104 family)
MAGMRVQDLASELERNPDLAARLKEDPQKALKDLSRQRPIYERDAWVYRIVVLSLGVAILIAAVGAVVLQYNGHDSPAILVALGSGAIGALAGLLAPSPGGA